MPVKLAVAHAPFTRADHRVEAEAVLLDHVLHRVVDAHFDARGGGVKVAKHVAHVAGLVRVEAAEGGKGRAVLAPGQHRADRRHQPTQAWRCQKRLFRLVVQRGTERGCERAP
jgi:hypothetical protein